MPEDKSREDLERELKEVHAELSKTKKDLEAARRDAHHLDTMLRFESIKSRLYKRRREMQINGHNDFLGLVDSELANLTEAVVSMRDLIQEQLKKEPPPPVEESST